MSDPLPIPEQHYATVDGGHRMHYLEFGTPQADAPSVVFLHGSGPGAGGHSNFKANYPFLAEQGFHVLVPDHIGYGRSDKPADVEYPIDFFVSTLMQTLDAAGVKSFAPIGNSLGGAVALKMALDYPERIPRMILMAPGGVEEQQEYFKMPGMNAMREFFSSGQAPDEKSMAEILRWLVHDPAHVNEELVAERLAVHRTQTPAVITTMKVPNMESRLGEIRCPVLCFWGSDEKFMPLSGILTLAQGCADIQLIVQSACGHWVMVEHAGMFNRRCLEFLQAG